MYLWGCNCFIHKYIAFWGKLIASPVLEEIIWIPPPFSPLHVSIVWEFVFSICPWSVGSGKMGWSRLQMLWMEIAKRSPVLCSHSWPWIKWSGKLPSHCCNWYTLSYANATRDMRWLQQAQRHITAVVHELLQGLQHTHGENVGLGEARKFSAKNSVD